MALPLTITDREFQKFVESGTGIPALRVVFYDAAGNPLLTALAEDAAHVSGDLGIMALGVRKDTAAALAGADGDYIPFITDSSGRLHVVAPSTQGVDTELPAAVAAADSLANPTAPSVLAHLMVLRNGQGNWARAVARGNNVDGIATIGDGMLEVISSGLKFNGSTWDRVRNNTESTLLASAARSGTIGFGVQTNYEHRGLLLTLDITVNATPSTLTLSVWAESPAAAGAQSFLAQFAGVSAVGTYGFMIYPGISESIAQANLQIQAVALPRTWDLEIGASAGTATYSLGLQYLL